MKQMRFEATLELSGWLIWDNEKKQYIADYHNDEEACKNRVSELNQEKK